MKHSPITRKLFLNLHVWPPLKWFRCAALIMGTALVIFVSFRTSAFDPDSPVYGHTFLTKSIAANGFSFNGKSVPEFTAFLTFSPNEKIRNLGQSKITTMRNASLIRPSPQGLLSFPLVFKH